LTSFLLLIS